ncbi:FadR/GntR family transcriptional regulator [Cetobacterium somerae]|uniref:FadR/GntR family transcriptional regulator n=1 Tax=Cetobacterium TaxID=180162 RepID=UPI001F06E84F|nr:FadR/GntR family transcriptional regulator [Cetobacterium somerae]MCX3068073.1 FadR/GntR family transcriptional regulator [Cetobacterium somerae]UPO97437.1 FadR family transcriptional regulator [Cetobacterium somerae]
MNIIKNSLPKQVSQAIEELILNDTYKIGDKIPTEPELMEMFKVSRNSVREAIQSLIQAGLLEAKQGKGTFVIAKKRLEVELINSLIKVDSKDISEVRNFLEENIVVLAIKHATEEDLDRIEFSLKNRNNNLDEVKENTEADINFHMSIAQATHNVLLIDLYQYISKYFVTYIASKIEKKESVEEIDKLHKELFLSIKNRDEISAKEIVKKIISL